MPTLAASKYFPPVDHATSEGVLAVGGRLDPAWLLDAYTHGIFPWPVHEKLLAWWSPDPRAVIELNAFHVSRRLQRTIRSGAFVVLCNTAFDEVIHHCATVQDRRGATWITPDMQNAYRRMHELGHAHSVECYHHGRLVGGVYGVAIGAMFAAESMFHTETDASKVALTALVTHLRSRGYQLLDIQQRTPHTARLGAIEISRPTFLRRLAEAIEAPVTFGRMGE